MTTTMLIRMTIQKIYPQPVALARRLVPNGYHLDRSQRLTGATSQVGVNALIRCQAGQGRAVGGSDVTGLDV
jgi:hypothetical protein